MLVLPQFQGAVFDGMSFGYQANALEVLPFLVDRPTSITHHQRQIIQLSSYAGCFAYAGIYAPSGKVVTWGKIPVGSGDNLGVVSAALVQPTSLAPGIYLWAFGSDAVDTGEPTGALGDGYLFDTDMMNMLPGGGSASSELSGGQMPATLGKVSEPYRSSLPVVCFY